MTEAVKKGGRDNPVYVELLTAEAQRACSAFTKAAGGKDHQNLPLPRWDDLPPRMQEAWREAVDAIVTGQVTH